MNDTQAIAHKKSVTILIVILLLVIAGGFYVARKKQITSSSTVPQATSTVVVQPQANPGSTASAPVCYLGRIVTPKGNDDTTLQVVFNTDGTASGQFNLLPVEKDKLTGPFTGTWKEEGKGTSTARVLVVRQTYMAEGVQAQEDRFFKLTPQVATISWDKGVAYTQSTSKNCLPADSIKIMLGVSGLCILD